MARAREQDIQAPLPALRCDWSEGHAFKPCAGDPRTVSDRYQDYVALVALNIFDALNEYFVKVLLLSNERIKSLIGATRLVYLICNLIALDRRERHYPQRLRGRLGCVRDKGVDDRLCL